MLRLINSMTELVDFIMQQVLLFVLLSMLFELILTQKLNIIGILLKINLSRKEFNSLTYPVYLNIKSVSFIHLLILKIRNPLLFVKITISLFILLY